MVPVLLTAGATRAARPACFTVMVPALAMRAPGRAGWSNARWPDMKFWLVMPAALTMTLCAFT